MVLKPTSITCAVLVGVAVVCPACRDGSGAPVENSSVVALQGEASGFDTVVDTARVKLAIEGMTCASCATTARIALERSEGVYRAEVSYDSASAVVTYDSETTAPPRFMAALRKLTGYEAVVAGESPKEDRR
jgi:copper chaperone CopZ